MESSCSSMIDISSPEDHQMGKGSRPRPISKEKFDANYNNINWIKVEPKKKIPKSIDKVD